MNFIQSLTLNDWITLAIFLLLACMAVGAMAYLLGAKHGREAGYEQGCLDEAKARRTDIIECLPITIRTPRRAPIQTRDYLRYVSDQ